ncbi:M23 family metallopeptidase [Candidatus Parcubacteria bacterium]|nr:M23 family metallopeptidase [Candidatus Parcubacteria bacterium]
MKKKTVLPLVASLFLVLFASVGSAFAGGINDMTSPLLGNWSYRNINLDYGETWTKRDTCTNNLKLHAGVDVQAWSPEAVYAAESGVVKVAESSPDGGWVTIEHTPSGESTFTTVYWHVTPAVSIGTTVAEGQWIGNIANLGSGTHFHFGVRVGSYTNTSNRGWLPQSYCYPDPAFDENFVDPLSLSYHNKTF